MYNNIYGFFASFYPYCTLWH